MRALFAVVALLTASPAFAGQCLYFNQNDQTLDWSGGDTVTFDPLYTDKVTCSLKPEGDNPNVMAADCGSYTDRMVLGASTREARNADIIVWGDNFYWLKCEKDHA